MKQCTSVTRPTLARRFAACALVILSTVSVAGSQLHAAVPASGLVGHWSFDEGAGTSAADGSGNGHTGSLQYGAGWASGGSCKRGACLALDGVDDYVRVPDTAGLRLTGDVTISAWIKPGALGSLQSIVSKRYEYELGPIAAASPYPLQWSQREPGSIGVSGRLSSSTTVGVWQHVVLVRDGQTRQIRGYKDGALALSSSYANPPGTSSYHLNIGRHAGGGQRFAGLIDEVRIYNRVLSAAEIAALFNEP
jgi:hypothetical protein